MTVLAPPPGLSPAPGLTGATGLAGLADAEPVPPEIRRPNRARRTAEAVLLGALGFVLLGLAWHLASTRAEGLPGPVATYDELRPLLGDAFAPDGPAGKGIALQLGDSLARVLKGFGLAVLIGVPVGFALGTSRRLRLVFDPVVQLLRPVSPLAWFPIWLTIFVKAEPSAVWVIFMAALWPLVTNTAAGVGSVPEYQLDVSRVFRFSRATRVREILVPHAMPSVVTGMRISMGVAWMVIVATEMLSASSGIGFFVWQSYNGTGLTHVLAAVLVIGAVGVVFDVVFQALGRLVTHREVRS